MSNKKRTIDSFFTSSNGSKKQRVTDNAEDVQTTSLPPSSSRHPTYPFPIRDLPAPITQGLSSLPSKPGRAINDQPDLDLVYFQPYLPTPLAKELFHFLRVHLPFYRVEYKIKRGGTETQVRTPRFTTVFGVDGTSRFLTAPSASSDSPSKASAAASALVDTSTGMPVPASAYTRYRPRPIPACLDGLRRSAEQATGCVFNFCLVNYYASGADSIAFHSDDERFLEPEPAIASFSLGARRDFLLRHKPPAAAMALQQVKLPLDSGDMLLMRGGTQVHWLHSIPKRTGRNEADGGRINITFRKAMVKAGTDNYYHYNVGTGPVFWWDENAKEMKPWRNAA